MEFCLFVWVVMAVLFILSRILGFVFRLCFISKQMNYLFLFGIVGLLFFLILYLPHVSDIWNILNNNMNVLIEKYSGNSSQLWKEVWHTIVFFRNIWPSIFIALIMMVLEFSQHPQTSRYRMMKKFGHNKMLIMTVMFFIYIVLLKLRYTGMISLIALNIAVYVVVYYWKFGFLTILHFFRHSWISYEIGTLILLVPVLFAGENFLLPLIFCVGIGVSDIWMDYHKRNSSAMLFSLDFS